MIEPAVRIASEQRIVERICGRWGCTSIRMPDAYGLTFTLLRGQEAIAWMDVLISESGLNDIDRAGGIAVPVAKWNAAQIISVFTARPYYIALQTPDGGFISTFRDIEFGSFHFRRDDDDTYSVMVPVKRFRNFRDCYDELKPKEPL